ncbi:MAG: DUF2341 domain-containing protein [Chitinispirillaceae bacterium]|nr:DUF2341 domain-containing protein [Chitinispirillaceae bacterium]
MKGLFLAWGLSFAALWLMCTQVAGPGGEGNGSETIARGVIVDSTGTPVADVRVQVLPASFNPVDHDTLPTGWQVRTDTGGKYRVGGLPAGIYSIEANGHAKGVKALVRDVEISGESVETVVDTVRLLPTATVVVRLSEVTLQVGGYVYLPGTNSYAVITGEDSTAGRIILNDVPCGSFSDLLYASESAAQPADILDDTLSVQPGDTVSTAYAAWTHSQRFFLNTTASGADVPENVYGFPLLVRLTDEVIDFSEALSAGEDIRFTRSDGTPLPFETERWDAAESRAEIWVRLDTVHGNNGTQSITMYWGNPAATDVSDGCAVFDTADGVVAVWHLNQECNDATMNMHNGSVCTASDTTGVIGGGKWFGGSDSITVEGLFGTPSSITLSAWVWCDGAVADTGGDIVSLGDAVFIRTNYLLDSLGTTGIIHESDGMTFYHVATERFLRGNGWHFLTFTVEESTSGTVLFIDGEEAAARTDLSIPINYSGIGVNTVIGNHGNGKGEFGFNGAIDEVRVCRKALPPEFVRLSYMNQKTDDALIRFR